MEKRYCMALEIAHQMRALPVTSRLLIFENLVRAGWTMKEVADHGPQALCRAAEMRRAMR
jgi:hypothetical protein